MAYIDGVKAPFAINGAPLLPDRDINIAPQHRAAQALGRPTRLRLALCCAALLALAPMAAQAGPGLGQSFGSRGSRTYLAPSSNGVTASPFQRSLTPQAPGYGYNQGYRYGGYGANRGGYGGGFGSMMLGGLLGAGLGGLLLGHGFFGFHGGSGLLGFLLQMILLVWLARWAMRAMLRQPQFAGIGATGGLGGMARSLFPPLQAGARGPGYGGPLAGAPRAASPGIALTQADYQQFSQLLMGIQAAWSRSDLNGLRAMATPEMVGYFAEQLAELSSRGVRNEVRDVRLLKGDLAEAWNEGNRDYATVLLKISMIDVTLDTQGRVVDGSPDEHVTITEFWTFLRSAGGHWILSAIQQTR